MEPKPPLRRKNADVWLLAAAVVLLTSQLGFLGTFTSASEDLFRFLSLLAVQFAAWATALRALRHCDRTARDQRTLVLIFSVAVLLRLLALPAGLDTSSGAAALAREGTTGSARPLEKPSGYQPFLLYDNDVWRYLFDGSLLAHGISPYRWTPHQIDGSEPLPPEAMEDTDLIRRIDRYVDDVLESDRFTDVFDRTSYRDVRTVYPPLAQWLFSRSFQLGAGSVFWWKLLVISSDLVTCMLLLRLAGNADLEPTSALLAWAWSPLVIQELAGSGHLDAFLVTLLVASVTLAFERQRSLRWLAPIALAGAALVKPTALAIAPALFWRVPLLAWAALPAIGALAWWPLRDSLPVFLDSNRFFAREWEFNSGIWRLVRDAATFLPGGSESGAVDLANALYAVALLLCGGFAWWRLRPGRSSVHAVLTAVTVLLGATVVLGPVVNPWYVLWALPFAALIGVRSWLLLSALVCLSYLHYLDASTPGWSLVLQHGGLLVALAIEVRTARVSTQTAA